MALRFNARTGQIEVTDVSEITFSDKAVFAASTTSTSSINLPHGTAPSSPVDGDIWTTSSSFFARINGTTINLSSGSGDVIVSGTPSDNQLAVWTGSNTIEGDPNLTFDGTNLSTTGLGIGGGQTISNSDNVALLDAVPANFTGTLQYDGTEVSTVDASSLTTGTLANARLDQQLQDVAGLSVTDGNFIVGDGSNFVVESGATARASLGANDASNLTTGTLPDGRVATSNVTQHEGALSIAGGQVDSGTLSDARLSSNVPLLDQSNTFTNGRIIFDNGTYMKVSGVGFGTSNQFLEWFGPSGSIGSVDENSAISYLKTNGDAFFGGSINLGTLTTSGTTSDQSSDASITIGPFASNGGIIEVTTSYSAEGVAGSDVSGSTVDVLVERRVPGGSGSWSTVDTHTFTASAFQIGTGQWSWAISGSHTNTDNLQTTDTREYRATMTNGPPSDPQGNQRLSITAVEE